MVRILFFLLSAVCPVLAEEEIIDGVVDTRDVWREAVTGTNPIIKILFLLLVAVAMVKAVAILLSVGRNFLSSDGQTPVGVKPSIRLNMEDAIGKLGSDNDAYSESLRRDIQNLNHHK